MHVHLWAMSTMVEATVALPIVGPMQNAHCSADTKPLFSVPSEGRVSL